MLGLPTIRFRNTTKPISFARTEVGYLTIVGRIVKEVQTMQQEFAIEPEVLVLGMREYTDILRYTHQKPANRGNGNPTGVITKFMGMQVVVVNRPSLLCVAPRIEHLFGIRGAIQ